MKLRFALISLLPVILAAPVPAPDGISQNNPVNDSGRPLKVLNNPIVDKVANVDHALDNLDGVQNGLNEGRVNLPDVLTARDADFAPVSDVTVIVKPEVEVLKARNGDDSTAIKMPGENLVDGINKSIGTKLNARQVQDLTQIADGLSSSLGLGNIGDDDGLLSSLTGKRSLSAGKTLVDDINKSISTQLNARQVQDLALLTVVDIASMLGLEENGNGEPAASLPSKPDLSPAEIMANARKALSAAESAYMKYRNEITKAAYHKAIETVQALSKSGY